MTLADDPVRREASFPPDPASAGAARRLLLGALQAADRVRWAESGSLALSEVVTNVIVHARTAFDVVIDVHPDQLRVEVRDADPALPQQARYDEQATTGRGMALIAGVTDECGVHSLGALGKAVWFTVGDHQVGSDLSADELLDAWDLDGDWQSLDQPTAGERTVTLLALPGALWLAARQHHDALLRELLLYCAEHDDVVVDLALAGHARGYIGPAVIAAIEDQRLAAGPGGPWAPYGGGTGALPWLPAGLTITLGMPADAGPAHAALQDALDAAEGLAVAGRLLVRPGLPEIVAVRDWACEQVVAQLAGVPPSPWPGTAQERFETTVRTTPDDDEPWDDTAIRDSERGVVAADDANRIVAISRSLAHLLGWEVKDLLGRRVVTIIPRPLREAHVAGFSRHQTTGEAHILGVPLVAPVLLADGRELPCHLLVERAPRGSRRSFYLAWIEPAEPT